MCDCFHLAFPNWHAASSGTGAGRRLRGPEPGTEDNSICDEPSQFTEGERPRPQGSSPVEEYPEAAKYTDSDKECDAEHDPHHKSGSGKKTKKSGLGSMFDRRSTPKMSKLKEVHSPESGVIVKTAKDGCAEGLVYGGGGKDGIFIKEVVPESPASKSLKLKEGDQILSATVYFDNMSYEDAIQILEHAQAYKVKLCLKRQPDITETEPTLESDVIPEEELYSPEMREQGKTKRRGDARISWPKFPSFGKGKKSRFTRSHSSSEADEQRKLELSPTTSDTESPIKSQDALKGKKKHKIKLPGLSKRGRISSSEDQDTDTPIPGRIPGKVVPAHETSDMLSPERLESPSGETPEVYVTEELKVEEQLKLEQNDQKLIEPQTVQHKAELITIDSTLKTADLTVALADEESPSDIKSPDGKKKKKERSELKIKILGKDKSHKKDTKAKASPKRLKTLGASIEIPDQPENEKSVIQSLESQIKLQGDQLALDTQIISDDKITKSPRKGEEKKKKGKDSKQKESPTFKLPKVGLVDIAPEETIQKMKINVGECTTKIERFTSEGTEVTGDPYERLSKSSQLPKREEIEIPGMEDMSMRTTTKGIKEPKVDFTGNYEDIQAETVQMSIDVDSVKEAVSKLPGFKLPKVDTSGVPIPEEIIVIDANAQRISVKTPTKVVDTKTKHETHFTKFDVTASPEISKTAIKLPKIAPADLTSEELLIETKVHVKTPEKKYKSTGKLSNKDNKIEVDKREDIIIPGKESVHEVAIFQTQDPEKTSSPKKSEKKSKKAKITTASIGITKPNIKIPDVGIHLPKQKGDTVKGGSTLTEDVKSSKTETRQSQGQIGGVICDVKISEIDGIEYIDSAGGSPAKKDGGISLIGFGVNLEAAKPNIDISMPEVRAEVKDFDAGEHTIKLPKFEGDISVNVPDADKDIHIEREGKSGKFKMPDLNISMPKLKGPKIDVSQSRKDADLTVPEEKAELPEGPEVDVSLGIVDVSIPEHKTDGELDGQGSKFRMPQLGITMPKLTGPEIDLNLSKKDVDVTLPEVKAEVNLPDVELKKPSVDVEIKTPEFKVVTKDTQGSPSKFKMPSFKLPKFGSGSPKKHVDITLPAATADLPEVPEVDVTLGNVDVSIPEQKTDAELDGQGSKFKMPKFGISLPKVKGPDIDLSSSKKDEDVKLPEAKAEVNLPDVESTEPGIKVEIKAPEIAVHQQDVEDSPSKFKMPSFKLPKFGVGTPKVHDMDKDIKIDEADIKIPEEVLTVDISAPSIDTEGPSIHIKTTDTEQDGKGSKFKMPHLGFSKPKVKGPKIDLSTSKQDVTLPEAKADIKLPEVDLGKVDVSIPDATAEVNLPEWETEMDGHGGKFKIPKLGIKMPKVKGPEFDLSLSKTDASVELPETKADVKLPEGDLGRVDVSIPEAKLEIKNPELEMQSLQIQGELDGQGERFKMPKFGIKIPKVKGPEFDLSFSKKDVDVTLPQTEAEVKLPDAPKMDDGLGKAEVLISETKMEVEKPELETKPLQIEAEGHGSKFKMPKFGMTMPNIKGPEVHLGFSKKDVDVTLSEAKADVNLPDVELKEPSAKVEIKGPEIKVVAKDTDGSPSRFKAPNFSFSLPKVKGPDIHLGLSKKDTDITLPGTKAEVKVPGAPEIDASLRTAQVLIPEAEVEVKKPEVEIKPLQTDVDLEGQGGKFKMPKFGVTMPKLKGPEIDSSFSKKDVDVTLPEAKAEVELPEAPKIVMDIEPPECEAGIDGQKSKLKMPKFGISMPKVKGPEIDFSVSKKNVDITLPEAKADISLPDVELKEPSAKVEIKGAEIEAPSHSAKGSPSKFKMPAFKFPKFGVATPNVSTEVPDVDKEIKVGGADVHISVPHKEVDIPEIKAEVQLPEAEVKEPSGIDVDAKMKKSRFSLPKFSFSKPIVKAPEVDVSLPDVNVAIPEAKVEVKGGEVDMKPPQCEAEVDGQGSKFKMPKFGMTMPKVEVPDIDLSLSKKNVDVTLPEAKAEVKLPDIELNEPSAKVEIKTPEIKFVTKDKEGSPSKYKMPTVKLPKFGVGMPSSTVEVPDMDKDIKIDGTDIKFPEEVLTVDIAKPSIDTEGPSIRIKTTDSEFEGKGSKFGIITPKVTGPEIDLNLSKKDIDVKLAEAKAEVKLPDVKVKEPSAEVEIKAPDIKIGTKETKESSLKFKMPTVKLPKFEVGTSSATIVMPDKDKDIKINGADIKIPKEVVAVDISAPSIDTEVPSIHMKTKGIEHEGKGSRFKMPSLGFSASQVKGPEIDLSLSKKDVDVTLPEVKAEAKLPDVELKKPSAEVEIKAPEIKVVTKDKERSPSKFKMPSFKLPKFGVGSPSASVEVPDVDKDIKIDGAEIKIPEEVLTVATAATSMDIEGPSIQMKTTGTEHEGKGSKFKMPSLGFSAPQVKGPEIDLGLSKKDVDVTLPEAKAEVKLPVVEVKEHSAKVEIKAPEIKVATKDKEGSPSKFKMPTFKLPKLGIGTPSTSVEVPNTDKDIKIDGDDIKIPEDVLTVEIAAPSIDLEGPSIQMKTKGTEHEEKGSKFKMPSLGFAVPQVKGPEIDLSLSKKDIDVTLPEAKAEVKLPDVELKKPLAEVEIKAPEIKVVTKDKERSPSKFKMPSFKLPKFGVGSPSASVEVPDVDKDIKIDGAEIKIPEEVLTVDISAPSIDSEGPSIHVKTKGTEHEEKGSKFKMPSLGFSVPQVKGPEIDLSLSKKDVDVTLPEVKAEVKPPHVELKKPSAEVEIKAPETKVATKDTEESPSKFKMPTFKLPKFGIGSPSASVEVPNTDKDIKIDGADIKIPEEVLTVETTVPSIDTKGPSIQMKTTGTEHEGKGSRFKMPSLGFSAPQVKGPEIDLSLSKKDEDVTLPEAKAEVNLPDVEVKESSAKVEIKAPGIDVQTSSVEGSPSKFKMPTFKLPKFGAATPEVSVEVPDVDMKVDGADLPQTKAEVKLPDVEIKESVDSTDGDAKLKKTRFSLPKFSFSKPSLPDVDVTLPEGHVEVKQSEVEPKLPEGDVELDGQGSKFKLPKFGISMPKAKGPEIDLSLSKKDVEVTVPEAKAELHLPDVKIKQPSTGAEPEVKGSKFKMPSLGFSVSQAKGPEIAVPEVKAEVKQPSAKVEIKGPAIEAQAGNAEGSPSKLKMPTFSFPKFGAATPKVSVEVPDVDKDIKLDEAKVEVSKKGAKIDVTAPSIDAEGLSVDVKAKGSDTEGSGSRFKMPKFGISMPKGKGPEIDLSLSKKDVDVTLPEVKAEVKQPSAKGEIKGPAIDAQTGNFEASPSQLKMPTFSFPKFGAATPTVSVEVPDVDKDVKIDAAKKGAKVDATAPSIDTKGISVDVKAKGIEAEGSGSRFKIPSFGISIPKVKAPEIDLSVSKTDVDVTLPEAKAEVKLPNVKVKELEVGISVPDAPMVEAEATTKRQNWTFPKFSFSRTGAKIPDVDGSLPEAEAKIKTPEMEMKVPELQAESDGQGSKFKLPKFGIALPSVKGPEVDLSASQKDVDMKLPEVKVDVKTSASVESDVAGSPSKFKMPKFGGDITAEAPDARKVAETDVAKIKDSSDVIKTDVSKAVTTDIEMSKTETDSMDLGSPSKFKLPSFKMPRVSFTRTKPEEEDVPVKTEPKEDQPEMEGESKSPKMSLTSFGEILKTIDVEFDVSKTDKEEENLETVKPSGKQLEQKEKETNIKQEIIKSPEKTSWFKFPRFGLSSPSEPAKTPEKEERKDVKSPESEEPSPISSIQSSDAFADISSAMTSEHVGLSLSSPTKVTVKYSDPNAATGVGEMHSNIITSTTRTELISVEPNLPEKIILSSGVSSSSEDTLRLDSGKIHVISSNIQATPEAQHTKLLTAAQVQPAGGFALQSEAHKASSWTVEDPQSGKRTFYERHLVRETSSERSESKETIVITKQITHMFDSSEPISGDTASSIQRLRDSVHSEKMRFFDDAEK